jgi:hypothetical protein
VANETHQIAGRTRCSCYTHRFQRSRRLMKAIPDLYDDIVRGKNPRYERWLTEVV